MVLIQVVSLNRGVDLSRQDYVLLGGIGVYTLFKVVGSLQWREEWLTLYVTLGGDFLGGTGDDALDGAGWIPFAHDFTMNSANLAVDQVNYMSQSTANSCYTVTADGTIARYGTAGAQTNP